MIFVMLSMATLASLSVCLSAALTTEVGLGGPILVSSLWMFVRHEFWFSMSMQACAIKACMSWVWTSEGLINTSSSEGMASNEGKSMRMKRKLSMDMMIFWWV